MLREIECASLELGLPAVGITEYDDRYSDSFALGSAHLNTGLCSHVSCAYRNRSFVVGQHYFGTVTSVLLPNVFLGCPREDVTAWASSTAPLGRTELKGQPNRENPAMAIRMEPCDSNLYSGSDCQAQSLPDWDPADH